MLDIAGPASDHDGLDRPPSESPDPGTGPIPMSPRSEQRRPRPPLRHSLVAVLAFSCAGLTGAMTATASGASVSAGLSRQTPHAGHLHCKCATRCRGASCCCAGDEPTDRPPTPARPAPALAPEKGEPSTGPCLQAAPCGGAEPMTPSPLVRIVDTAALVAGPSCRPNPPVGRLAPCLSDLLPEVERSRPEEPPERVQPA